MTIPDDDRAGFAEEQEEPQPLQEATQFSLRELFLLTAFAAVLFTGFRWAPPGVFATGLGVGACMGLFLLWYFQVDRSSVRLAWWLVLLTYLLAAYLAVARTREGNSTHGPTGLENPRQHDPVGTSAQ